MGFTECIKSGADILMEGALGERLKREYKISFDENIAMAGLVRSIRGRAALYELWKGYLDIAREYGMPFIATTPTRRANRERIEASDFDEKIFEDNVQLLRSLQEAEGAEMYVGGLMGCKGDAYTGEGRLSEEEAYEFHKWTAERFGDAGVDFIFAAIMPTLPEAAGLARAVSDVGVPYIISFTIQKDGKLIDGTSIAEAISYIDGHAENKPVCYMANCVHPRILYEALSQPFNRTKEVLTRFKGLQANTSPLSYAELDNAVDLKSSEPEALAEDMIRLKDVADIKVWGGCCGTDDRHMRCIARKVKGLD